MEHGDQTLEYTSADKLQIYSITVPKDNRAIAHLALLEFMQRESLRLGFNKAVDDFVL